MAEINILFQVLTDRLRPLVTTLCDQIKSSPILPKSINTRNAPTEDQTVLDYLLSGPSEEWYT